MRLPPQLSGLPSLGSLALLVILIVVLVTGGGDDDDGAGSDGESGAGESVRVPVVDVVDGDTIEVRIDGEVEDVRYIGVDTPESVKPDTPVECFGPQASHFNERSVEGETVRLDFDAERRDVYGRLLAYVYVGRPVRQRRAGRARLRDDADDRPQRLAAPSCSRGSRTRRRAPGAGCGGRARAEKEAGGRR